MSARLSPRCLPIIYIVYLKLYLYFPEDGGGGGSVGRSVISRFEAKSVQLRLANWNWAWQNVHWSVLNEKFFNKELLKPKKSVHGHKIDKKIFYDGFPLWLVSVIQNSNCLVFAHVAHWLLQHTFLSWTSCLVFTVGVGWEDYLPPTHTHFHSMDILSRLKYCGLGSGKCLIFIGTYIKGSLHN